MIGRRIPQRWIRLASGPIVWAAANAAVFSGVLVHAETKSSKFLGETIIPAAPAYFVLKDVNVRGKPLTKSPRVGRMRKGLRVQAVGKAKGANWIAVRKQGKDWGFVYASALAPVLDGTISKPLTGKLSVEGLPGCDYVITYEGRHPVDGDLQIISDYVAELSCNVKSRKLVFNATMFLTELPSQNLRKDIFQVNVDLLAVKDKEEEIMSVTSLFEYGKKEVMFDSVTIDSFARTRPGTRKKAISIPAVLTAALEFAHEVWGPLVWTALGKAKKL